MVALDLNRILKLKIRSKLIIAFIALSLIPVLIVGLTGISSNAKAMREIAINNLDDALSDTQKELDLFYSSVENNVSFLISSFTFNNFITAFNSEDSADIENAISELMPDVISLTRNESLFYQIRFISSEGTELFGVEDDDSAYSFLRQSDLNNTSTRFYRYIAENIPANTASFLPVELISSDHERLVPSISCIYHIRKKEFFGVLVLQIYADKFFRLVENDRPGLPGVQTIIANNEGFYLYHSEKKTDWNQLSASKQILNLRSDFGDKVAQNILSLNDKAIYESGKSIIAQARVFESEHGMDNEYTLILSILKKEIFKSVNKGVFVFGGLLLIFLILSFILALMATKHFINPINNLINKANIISGGNYDSIVEIDTRDEIQKLAEQFNNMAGSLKHREDEINQHKKDLELTVLKRTRDLAGEKNKLQTIFDFAPIGFILFDAKFKILSASAAIESISGFKPDQIIGENYLKVFKWNHETRNHTLRKIQSLGNTITDYSAYASSDGMQKYHEHILIPVGVNPKKRSILEIITDITERKKMQDMLIHSERLAATGELAAVIAHEIRNSLTSVRMVIQLLSKKDSGSGKDSDSLEVVLDSVNRMENVVNDLLRLASPGELKKEPTNVNEILKSGIDFVMPQLQNKHINIKFKEEKNNAVLFIDKGRIKEAVINILLNAIQAIENSGEIRVELSTVKLDRMIKDFARIRNNESDNSIYDIREIVLKKGSETLKIMISDTGQGIPSMQKDRIFSPFYTTKNNGTGLGLTFVQRVINQHGGVISVDSEVDNGSCFTILLPTNTNEREL
jgi:PAS domain S-box-containing protein